MLTDEWYQKLDSSRHCLSCL